VTHLRQLMLDELQRRNYSQSTVVAISTRWRICEVLPSLARSPGPEHIREYQVHLFRDRKLSPGTIEGRTCALRFLFVKTLAAAVPSRSHSVSQASAAAADHTRVSKRWRG
jgi:integrase/recombinase XerD